MQIPTPVFGCCFRGAATQCPHAAPDAAAPCDMEILTGFDCALYASTCGGVTGYQAYADRASTVLANGANDMECRTQHLSLAAGFGGRLNATVLMRRQMLLHPVTRRFCCRALTARCMCQCAATLLVTRPTVIVPVLCRQMVQVAWHAEPNTSPWLLF